MHGTQTMAPRRKKPAAPAMPPDVVVVMVDNPYEFGPAKTPAVASRRDDPLLGMLSRKQIDSAQFEAGRLWQKYREQSEGVSGIKAMDPTNEPVDGSGGYPDPITDTQRKAVVQLKRADGVLGTRGREIVEMVLWQRYSIIQVSAALGFVSRKGVEYQGGRFRECLEALAKLWGLAQ
jgi:hypothetical protein